MAQITVSLESPAIIDADEIINIPGSVEITADIELPEIWGFRGNTIGYGRPYILGVEFSCNMGIGSPEANRVFEKYLLGEYETDQKVQDKVNALILDAYYSAKAEAEIDAYEAERARGVRA